MKVLMYGPLTPPIHGQSLAFTKLYESIDDSILININNDESNRITKILKTFLLLCEIFYKTLFFKYDIVYFTCSRSILGSFKDVVFINLVSFRKKKIINHLHGSDFNEFINNVPYIYSIVLKYSYRKVNTSIVLLESMKSEFKDFENMNVEVVSNFYEDELNNVIVERDKEKVYILYLSNIIKSKGIFELIESFSILCEKYENIELNIAGGFIADEFMTIKEVESKFYEKIKNNNRINYFGKVYGNEKIRLLQKSDIFVLPSYYKSEAFPISIIEAMVTKNVIVTTKFKYLPEIINEKNGLLIEPRDVNSLKSALDTLLSKSDLNLIQEYNTSEAVQKYSIDKYIKKIKNILGIKEFN